MTERIESRRPAVPPALTGREQEVLARRNAGQSLAEIAGARRETLSTVLQDFRDDDVLDLRYARIDIKDMDALLQIAGMDALPFLSQNGAKAGAS